MGTPRPQTKPSLLWLPSQSVLQRRGGIWGQLRFSHVIGRTQLLSGEVLALHRGCSWVVLKARQGPEPMPSHLHLDLIILVNINKPKGVCLHCAGHRGPAACLGCPLLFIHTFPRSPTLGRHLH